MNASTTELRVGVCGTCKKINLQSQTLYWSKLGGKRRGGFGPRGAVLEEGANGIKRDILGPLWVRTAGIAVSAVILVNL